MLLSDEEADFIRPREGTLPIGNSSFQMYVESKIIKRNLPELERINKQCVAILNAEGFKCDVILRTAHRTTKIQKVISENVEKQTRR